MFRYVEGIDPVTGKLRRRTVTITAKSKTAAQTQTRKFLAEDDEVTTGTSVTLNIEEVALQSFL
jgi:hypothetical protein